ncbi:hypothetical protein FHX74_000261 [Friedmanniella endophytica]|uniref:Right handed beta helix region n=1 Tax=Microlunatus kandeliicorticis TaxID=1759536 RepID=A0A7W3IP69_9ACTN|nr:right-handed parallel beta-helix repeat-containing protein [Microlunatus kandeliicorticis]MBA8792667.1 hypothetical protein [Microlunatus kandeliicorticis]
MSSLGLTSARVDQTPAQRTDGPAAGDPNLDREVGRDEPPAPRPGRRRALLVAAVVAVVLALVAGLVVLLLHRTEPASSASSAAPTEPQIPANAAAALDTDYPVPADAVVVAPSGEDGWPGSLQQPVRTLRQAIAVARPGATIVMRAGVYREGSTGWVTKSLTVQAYPHEQVWLDGSDVVAQWRRDGDGLWSTPWRTPGLCGGDYESTLLGRQTADGPCSHPDMASGVVGDPQQAWLDGAALTQYATRAEAARRGGFSYDHAGHRLYLGVDPAGHRVELARRPTGLAVFGGGTRSFTVRGIGFRHYATNEYTNQTSGALVLNRTLGGRIERVAATANSGGGVLTWQARKLVISGAYLSGNGFDGLWVDGSARTGERDDFRLENSSVDGNNTAGFGADCDESCGAAGAKMSFLRGAVIRDNSFSHNRGRASGWWCDTWCSDVTVSGNLVVGNGNFGLGYELSETGLLADNLVLHNGWQSKASGIMVGSTRTGVYNNSIVDNYSGALLYDDPRSGTFKGYRLPPDTRELRFVDNLVSGGAEQRPQVDVRAGGPGGAGNTTPSEFVRQSDANSYFRPPGSSAWVYYWEEKIGSHELYTDLAALTARRRVEQHSSQIEDGDRAPFFVDPATGDYDLDPGYRAANPGVPVPPRVAAVLGLPTGEAVPRGAPGVTGVGRLDLGGIPGSAVPAEPVAVQANVVGPPPATLVARLDGSERSLTLPVALNAGGWAVELAPKAFTGLGPATDGYRLTVSAYDGRGRLLAAAEHRFG